MTTTADLQQRIEELAADIAARREWAGALSARILGTRGNAGALPDQLDFEEREIAIAERQLARLREALTAVQIDHAG